MAAKLEIGVFLLAALLHFLLFSNRAPAPKVSKKVEKLETGATMARTLKPMVRSGAQTSAFLAELRSQLQAVPMAEHQAVLAQMLEGLRQADAQLLCAVRTLAGKVTDIKLIEELLRCYLALRSRSEFEELLQEVEAERKPLPSNIAALSIQFALSGDNLESALGRLPGMRAHENSWELLEKVMKDFLPLVDDAQSIHVCFHRILDHLVKTQPERVWDVLKRMEQQKVLPNNVTCSILLKGVHKDMKDCYLKRVMKVIDARVVKDMDEVLLGSLYEACIRCGQVHELLKYVQKLREDSGLIQIKSAHTVGSIIRAHGVDEDLDAVWATWNEMKAQRVIPSRITLGCMVEALASNHDAEGAYEIIQQALADPQTAELVNAVTYSSVLKSFNHQKRFHRVWDIYDEMIHQEVEFTVTTYNALLDVCARSGEIARAEPLLKDMAKQGVVPNIITYGTVIKAYCSANRLEQAFAVLTEMQKNTDLHPDEVTYNTLLDGCARYGLFDRGLSVLADMRKAKVPPSNYTLSVIAKLANRSKMPKKAFEMVESLRREFGLKLNMHVYNNLIHAATCDNDMLKAQETFATMLGNKVRPDARTYTLLLRFSVTKKSPCVCTVFLRAAVGLTQEMTEGLHPALMKVLQQPLHWAAAPLRGNNALTEEVLHDVFDFLSRQGSPRAMQQLLKEVQQVMTLRLPKSITNRILP